MYEINEPKCPFQNHMKNTGDVVKASQSAHSFPAPAPKNSIIGHLYSKLYAHAGPRGRLILQACHFPSHDYLAPKTRTELMREDLKKKKGERPATTLFHLPRKEVSPCDITRHSLSRSFAHFAQHSAVLSLFSLIVFIALRAELPPPRAPHSRFPFPKDYC